MMPRGPILVTGAGGFVGSAIMRALAASTTETRPIVGLIRPGGSRERLVGTDRCTIIEADMLNPTSLSAALSDVAPSAIVHVALPGALFGKLDGPTQHRLIEVPLAQLCDVLPKGGRLITTGTAAVVHPGPHMGEDDTVAPNPSWHDYAINKIQEERVLAGLTHSAEIEWVHLRLFFVFGQFEAPTRLLPYVVRQLAEGQTAILTRGAQIRDFTDVDDIAGAYLAALTAPQGAAAGLYHVGTGTGVSVREIAERAAAIMGGAELLQFGTKALVRGSLTPCIICDPSRIATGLGWRANPDTLAQLDATIHRWRNQIPGPKRPYFRRHAP